MKAGVSYSETNTFTLPELKQWWEREEEYQKQLKESMKTKS